MQRDLKPIPTPLKIQLREVVLRLGPLAVFTGTVLTAAHMFRTYVVPTPINSELDALKMPSPALVQTVSNRLTTSAVLDSGATSNAPAIQGNSTAQEKNPTGKRGSY